MVPVRHVSPGARAPGPPRPARVSFPAQVSPHFPLLPGSRGPSSLGDPWFPGTPSRFPRNFGGGTQQLPAVTLLALSSQAQDWQTVTSARSSVPRRATVWRSPPTQQSGADHSSVRAEGHRLAIPTGPARASRNPCLTSQSASFPRQMTRTIPGLPPGYLRPSALPPTRRSRIVHAVPQPRRDARGGPRVPRQVTTASS